jgi:hypothetical protein
MSTEDRRTPGATRVPFEGLVEVGAAVGTAFEAQAVNVSQDGMQLRTAYLPDAGQPLSCRFDAGNGESVLASGEVVWAHGDEQGGQFGVRFTDMDAESVEGLRRIVGLTESAADVERGGKVRLHIDGLGSPMRAKVKESGAGVVTVGSDLGFLQVGKELELEDAKSGNKRAARIDRVDVAVDSSSQVPQLVVTLSYANTGAQDRAPSSASSRAAQPAQGQPTGLEAAEQASGQMRGAVSAYAERIRESIGGLARSASTTVGLLLKARGESTRAEVSPRRTTAPAPGGGLRAEGRRVLRSQAGRTADATEDASSATSPRNPRVQRRAVLLGAALLAVAALGAAALRAARHQAGHDATATAASAPASATAAPATSAVAAASQALPSAAPAPSNSAATASPFAALPPTQPAVDGTLSATDEERSAHKKHAHVTPFANGSVHHGNALRLRMDGPIESIEGTPQANGFTVKIPGRRSLEAAAPLAARDSRIASMKIANDTSGAALTVSFHDGIPNYRVSARGDTLVILIAPPGALERPVAKRDDKSDKSLKRGSHPRVTDGPYDR